MPSVRAGTGISEREAGRVLGAAIYVVKIA
jgi:hypothetical protein